MSNGTCLRFPIIHMLELPGETESGSAHDASETRDIQAPVRPWPVRPLTANAVGGRFFPPIGHRTYALENPAAQPHFGRRRRPRYASAG